MPAAPAQVNVSRVKLDAEAGPTMKEEIRSRAGGMLELLHELLHTVLTDCMHWDDLLCIRHACNKKLRRGAKQLRSAATQTRTCWKAVAHSCGQLKPPVELTCSPWQACAAVVPAVPTLPHAADRPAGSSLVTLQTSIRVMGGYAVWAQLYMVIYASGMACSAVDMDTYVKVVLSHMLLLNASIHAHCKMEPLNPDSVQIKQCELQDGHHAASLNGKSFR
jgi:hypothetical protein